MTTTLKELIAEGREEFVPGCIDPHCNDNGVTIRMGDSGEPEQEQCQYCHMTRFPALAAIESLLTRAYSLGEVEGRKKEADKIREAINDYVE